MSLRIWLAARVPDLPYIDKYIVGEESTYSSIMPPKGAKGPKAKQKPQEEQREDILQAVVRGPKGSLCTILSLTQKGPC